VTTDEGVEDQHIDSCLSDLHKILRTDSPVFSCYKPTKEDIENCENKIATCLDSVLRVLGLDSTKVSDSDTLTDLGVDSLQVVTIKSILKNKGKDLSVAEVYLLKVSDIRCLD
jgi:aryl carrier-like protein